MLKILSKLYTYAAITGLCLLASCKREYIDPNRVPDTDALTTSRGLTSIAIGLQKSYTVGRSAVYNSFSINGLITGELYVRNTGNASEVLLERGGSFVDGANVMLSSYWSNNNKIIFDANLLLANANNISDKNYVSGLVAYASIFKALCIGNMAMYWEKIPDTIGKNAPFISRVDGFKKAIRILDNAIAVVTANPVSQDFYKNLFLVQASASTQVPAINIINTLHALKARYALFAGDYNMALAAANQVDLTNTPSNRSVFVFDPTTPNPIYDVAVGPNNVVQIVDSTLGLPIGVRPSLTDKRIPFYTNIETSAAPRFRINGFGATNTTQIPIYLPGEIMLIKAEAYARQNNLANARVELNKVVTKLPGMDPFGIGADQPALPNGLTQDQILFEIYRNRCIELCMSGLKLEDMRRFNRPLTERKRNFMPYPFAEKDNNPNTSTDPAF